MRGQLGVFIIWRDAFCQCLDEHPCKSVALLHDSYILRQPLAERTINTNPLQPISHICSATKIDSHTSSPALPVWVYPPFLLLPLILVRKRHTDCTASEYDCAHCVYMSTASCCVQKGGERHLNDFSLLRTSK
jgi:hypothetical protein